MKLTLLRACLVLGVAFMFGAAYLPRSTAQVKGRFSHSSPKHQSKSCATCHTMPAANWLGARGFHDVAQFPGSCILFLLSHELGPGRQQTDILPWLPHKRCP